MEQSSIRFGEKSKSSQPTKQRAVEDEDEDDLKEMFNVVFKEKQGSFKKW